MIAPYERFAAITSSSAAPAPDPGGREPVLNRSSSLPRSLPERNSEEGGDHDRLPIPRSGWRGSSDTAELAPLIRCLGESPRTGLRTRLCNYLPHGRLSW